MNTLDELEGRAACVCGNHEFELPDNTASLLVTQSHLGSRCLWCEVTVAEAFQTTIHNFMKEWFRPQKPN